MSSKLFVSQRVCCDNQLIPAGVLVKDGKIDKILKNDDIQTYRNTEGVQVIDAGNNVIMPGVIDSHVHINEPGRTEWEGYLSATQAAAAGGITTIIDMPLNSIPPTTTVENFRTKLQATENKLYVDVGFWGGFISGNQDDLPGLIEAGVVGFKCFMCPSGVDEFPNVDKEKIEQAMQILNGTDAVLAFHAEIEEIITPEGDPNKYSTYLNTRTPEMEVNAIRIITELCKKYNVKCHIVHLSAADALPLIIDAKANGCKLTVETCHHYLSLRAEDVPDGHTEFKCCPPIRDSENQNRLWQALSTGVLDFVVSDHSPCTADLKLRDDTNNKHYGNFLKAWGGVSSVQLGLSLFWTHAKTRGFNICDLTRYLTGGPARLCGLSNQKGAIKKGYDADFVIWNPEEKFVVEKSMIYHKNKLTPYLGKELYGKVVRTVVRGQTVFANGVLCANPVGKCLLKKK